MSYSIKLVTMENMIYPNMRKTSLSYQKFGEVLTVALFVLSYFYGVCVC